MTTDFEENVRSGVYAVRDMPYSTKEDKIAYRAKQNELHTSFMTDLRAWLVAIGVPEKYTAKVADIAYDEGHSCGYSEVVNHAVTLAGIFA